MLITGKTMLSNGYKINRIPVLLLLVFALLINLQEWLKVYIGLDVVGNLDEVVAVSVYAVFLFMIRKKGDLWIIIVLCFPFLSFAYSVIYNLYFISDGRLYEVAVQSIINVRIFLYGILLVFFIRRWISEAQVLFVFNAIFALCVIGVVANLLFPSEFVYSTFQYDLDRNRIIGFQYTPNDLAIFVSFYFCYRLFLKRVTVQHIAMLALCVIVVLATTSRTALMVIVMALCFFLYLKKSPISYAALFFCSAIFVLSFWETITASYYVTETLVNFSAFDNISNTEYIRFIMVYNSFVLAIENFPFGVGAANFGSVMSEGSFVYSMLGLSNMSFFVNMEGVYDSNLASIVGEYGVFGVVLYLYFMVLLLKGLGIRNRLLIVFLVSLAFFVSFTMAFFSYSVNSVAFLLMAVSFSYSIRKGDMILSKVAD